MKVSLATGRLSFSTNLPAAILASEIIFIAVGTPSRENGEVDLSQVVQVAQEIAQHIDAYKVVVIKSTVPVGTAELVQSILGQEKREGEDFDIVANPEFLMEGRGLQDFHFPDRIIIGTSSEKARGILYELYEPVIQGVASGSAQKSGDGSRSTPIPVIETSVAAAQMIKYASNAFLATRVSFINEIAGICERVNTNIQDVVRGMGFDSRIGHSYFQAGLGFGGPCLEKDLQALIHIAEGIGYEPQVLRSVLERNDRQLDVVLAKLKQSVESLLYRKNIGIFGLSFKSGSNDVRNSLSLKVIDRLEGEGAEVHAHDPVAIPEARLVRPNLRYHNDPYDAIVGADALLILTDWSEYADLDFNEIKSRMSSPSIIDGRNLLQPAKLRDLGFNYSGMGQA